MVINLNDQGFLSNVNQRLMVGQFSLSTLQIAIMITDCYSRIDKKIIPSEESAQGFMDILDKDKKGYADAADFSRMMKKYFV